MTKVKTTKSSEPKNLESLADLSKGTWFEFPDNRGVLYVVTDEETVVSTSGTTVKISPCTAASRVITFSEVTITYKE